MGKDCEFIYLDESGNKSPHYYDLVNEVGHEAAEKNYISKTIEKASVKFSRFTDTEDLKKEHNKVGSSNFNRSEYVGVTSIINDHANPFPEEAVFAVAVQHKALDIIDEYRSNGNGSKIDFIEAKTKARSYFEELDENGQLKHKAELDLYKEEVKNKFSNQAKQGELIHQVIQKALEERNRRIERGEDTSFRSASSLTSTALDEMESIHGRGFLTTSIQNNLNLVVSKVINRIEQLEKEKGTIFNILPEQWIVGKDTKFNGKKVYGRSDILLHSPKTNTAIILDLKTKSESSVNNFDTVRADKMNGIFSDLLDNSKTHANIQTSIYADILKNDYGISYVENETFLITGTMSASKDPIGSRDWNFTAINPEDTRSVEGESYSGLLTSLFDVSESDNTRTSQESIDTALNNLFQGNLTTIQDNTERHVDNQMTTVRTTKNGQLFWYDKMNQHKEFAKTEEEMKKIITKVYKEFAQSKKDASRDFITLFTENKVPPKSIWNRESYREKAGKLLDGISKDTHDIFTSHNLKELKGVGTDVLVIQDKKSKEISLVSLAPIFNSSHTYHEDGAADARTTILGPMMTDDVAKATYGPDNVPKSDYHNLNLFRLALIAADLKRKSPGKFGKIRVLKSVSLIGKVDNFRSSIMGSQLSIIGMIKDELERSNKDVPQTIIEAINNPVTMSPEEYEANHFDVLVDLLREYKDPLNGVMDDKAKSVRRSLIKRINQLDESEVDLTADYELEKRLAEYIKEVYKSVAHKRKVSLKEVGEISKDPGYEKAVNAYLSLRGALVLNQPNFKGKFLASFNSANTANDPFADAFNRIVTEHEQRAREEITPFMAEHNRLVENLMKKSQNTNLAAEILNVDVYKKVFAPMMRDEFNFSNDQTEDWMRFKDVDDITLTPEEREYIKFFNSYVKKSSRKVMGSNSDRFKNMYPETPGENDSWREGDLPIIPSSATLDLQETLVLEGNHNALGIIGKAIKKTFKKQESGKQKSDIPWDFTSGFMDQVDMDPGRGSKQTRELLGITADGTALPQDRQIEKNPVLLLNLYMLTAIRKEHMEQAAFATHALDSSILTVNRMFPETVVDVEPIRELISNLSKIRIHGRYNEEGRVGNMLDAGNRAASIGLFWGSLRQLFTEGATATVQTGSSLLSTGFNNVLFKGDNKYEVKDYTWAASKMASPFGHQLMADYGLYNSDLGQYSSSDYIGTRKGSMWQTKWGFAPIHNVLRQSTQAVILAQMHKEGVTNNAYDMDEKTGRFTYNEEKDNRFYVYDEKLGLGKEPPKSKEDIEKNLLWKAHRIKMEREGSIKDGKMTRPFTIDHLQSMKSYAIRLFGAMDSSQALAAEISATGRSLLKFKKWMRQKVDNIYAPTYKSTKEGRWDAIRDENGNVVDYDFMAEEIEGYWQSMAGLVQDLKRVGWKDTMAKSSTRRKENLSKILSDFLLFLLLKYSVDLLMESDLYDNVLGKEIVKGTANAVGDIMPVQGLWTIADSSPFAATSVLSNALSNTAKSITYLGTGDFEKSGVSAHNAVQSLGSYRFVEGILDTFK